MRCCACIDLFVPPLSRHAHARARARSAELWRAHPAHAHSPMSTGGPTKVRSFRKRPRVSEEEGEGEGAGAGAGGGRLLGAPAQLPSLTTSSSTGAGGATAARVEAAAGDAVTNAGATDDVYVPRAPPAKRREVEPEAASNATHFSSRAARSGEGVAASSAEAGERDEGAAGVHTWRSARTAEAHRYGGDAFATTAVDTEHERDARTLLEKKIAMQDAAAAAVTSDVKLYRGSAGYASFVKRDAAEMVAKSKVSGTLGPLRAPSNVRGICRFDYQPDVCKDFKETGYCNRGDTCIFLHDRSDYKSGWQLEKEWEASKAAEAAALAAKLRAGVSGAAEGSETREGNAPDGLPFACAICRKDFVRPIVTRCGHYFCESCAVTRYRTTPLCAVCNAQTAGTFNAAPKLEAALRVRAQLASGARGGAEEEGAAAKDRDEERPGGWTSAGAAASAAMPQGALPISSFSSADNRKDANASDARGGWVSVA
ncbi:hypothetical protein EON67_04700 [archaeon]|nr:MAG: hypothetical protein EON67_04700 [archaeon]